MKVRHRWTGVGVLAVLLVLLSYVLWQNFGLFLEGTIPLVLLLVHFMFDTYAKTREELSELRAKIEDLSRARDLRRIDSDDVCPIDVSRDFPNRSTWGIPAVEREQLGR